MKYIPDMNLLRSYSDVTDRLPTPTLAVFEFGDKKLIYCGTKHSADVSFQLIDKCFNDYDIDCVVTEVHRNATNIRSGSSKVHILYAKCLSIIEQHSKADMN